MAKLVKVGIVPGRTTEVGLEDGQTVRDALQQADLPETGYTMMINGRVVGLDTVPADGNFITLTVMSKGN